MTVGGPKLLADHPAHAQALALSRDGWRTVLSLPLACEELGEECPEWAWQLCVHVAAVAEGAPAELLEALDPAVRSETEASIASDLAELGVSLDLCEVLDPPSAGEARIRLTAFGFAVVVLR